MNVKVVCKTEKLPDIPKSLLRSGGHSWGEGWKVLESTEPSHTITEKETGQVWAVLYCSLHLMVRNECTFISSSVICAFPDYSMQVVHVLPSSF